MTSLKRCLKKEMVAMEEGVKIGRPADILLDTERHQVAVLIVSKANAPQLSVTVRRESVRSFETDNLAVTDLSAVKLAYQDPANVDLISKGVHMRGREVLYASGTPLGRIADVDIDGAGNVLQYLVRRNLMDYVMRRSHPVTPADLHTAGEQVAVTEQGFEDQQVAAGSGDNQPVA